MGSDFVDRAKLEALANERSPHLSGVSKFLAVETFMAGVDATLALLDAETTEEWGVSDNAIPGVHRKFNEGQARAVYQAREDRTLHSRRVIYGPWLPSEGGEKP